MFARPFWTGHKERTPLSTISYVHRSIEYSVCGHACEHEIAVPFIFMVVASLVDSSARPVLVQSIALNYCDLSRRSQSGRNRGAFSLFFLAWWNCSCVDLEYYGFIYVVLCKWCQKKL